MVLWQAWGSLRHNPHEVTSNTGMISYTISCDSIIIRWTLKKNSLSWKFLSPNPQFPRRARRTRAYCHTIPIRKWGTWTSTSWSFFSVDNLNMSCMFYTCIRATALFQRSSLLALGLFCLLWSVQLMPDFSPAIFNYPQLWLGAGCLPFVPTPIFWVWFQVWFLGSRCSKVS